VDRRIILAVFGILLVAWAAFGLTSYTVHLTLTPQTAALEPPRGGWPEVPVQVGCSSLLQARHTSLIAEQPGIFGLTPSGGPCGSRAGVSRALWAGVMAFLVVAAVVVLVAPRRGVRPRKVVRQA
jgi:hypothetical protein